MTAPEPDATLDAFYLRVRPGGPGWAHVSERLGSAAKRRPAVRWRGRTGSPASWRSTATLFGIGKLIFGELGRGFACWRRRGCLRLDCAVVQVGDRAAGREWWAMEDRIAAD